MALPQSKAHLEGFVSLLVERLLEDAREILDESSNDVNVASCPGWPAETVSAHETEAA